MLRFAVPADAEALLSIYAQYIDTPITFECALPSVREFRDRILQISEDYPYLVCERDGLILGYAYAHRYKEREAYQWGAELSVYLDRSAQSRGVGKRLYAALMALLSLQGIKTVYGCVTLPNDKSTGLHESFGFVRVAVLHRSGWKCGAWHDTAWYEKAIAPYDDEPAPVRRIRDAEPEIVRNILYEQEKNA